MSLFIQPLRLLRSLSSLRALVGVHSDSFGGGLTVLAGAACTDGDHRPRAVFNVGRHCCVGTVGSLVGAIIAYEVGRSAGRDRSSIDGGKWLLLTHDDLEKSERWFEKYGTVSVLVSRVIPSCSIVHLRAGRHCRMKRGLFDLLTAIGSAVWVALLAGLGYAAGKNWNHVSKDFSHRGVANNCPGGATHCPPHSGTVCARCAVTTPTKG